jgi:hypothetical protein
MSLPFKMTNEERLALRLKMTKGDVVLNRFAVCYLHFNMGKSLRFIARFKLTKSGRSEFIALLCLAIGRDLIIASPALGTLLGSIIYHFIK